MGLWDGIKTEGGGSKPASPSAPAGFWSGLNSSTSSPTVKTPVIPSPTPAPAPAPSTGLWSGLQYTPPKQSSPELSPTYPQPTEKPQEQGVFSKIKGFFGGLFGKDSEKSNAAPQLNVPETPKAPEIKPPEGAKIGDVFTAADGKQYKVVPPALESYLPGKMTSLTVAPINTAVSQTTPIAADKGTVKQVSDALTQIKKENENITFGEFVKSVPDAFAEIVGRPQLRAYGAVGGAVAKRLGLSEQDYTPLSKFERDVFGSENPLTLTSVGRETRGADKAGESKGVFKYADPAVGLIVGSLDALDGGTLGRLSKILRASKEAKVAISQSTDAAEIAGILRREIPDLTDNLAKAFAEPLRYIDNADDVEKVLNRTKFQLQEINKANGFNEPMQLAGEIKNVASDIESLPITGLQKNALQALREGYVTDEVVDVLKTIDPGVLDRVPVKSKTPAYQGETDLTTKILRDLEGKTTVSKQYILDATNRGELKQTERNIIRDILEGEADTVSVADFANKVKSELLPLKTRVDEAAYNQAKEKRNLIFKKWEDEKLDPLEASKKYPEEAKELDRLNTEMRNANPNAFGGLKSYESTVLPDELRGPIANYSERVYESPIKTSAGNVHYPGTTDSYFAHSRIEDLPALDKVSPRKTKGGLDIYGPIVDDGSGKWPTGDTRRVIEIQSDLFQKGRLEGEKTAGIGLDMSTDAGKEYKRIGDEIKRVLYDSDLSPAQKVKEKNRLELLQNSVYQEGRKPAILAREAELAKLEPYRNTWHERIIREEVKQAAIDGKTKLQFPTGETAMKIEGLGETNNLWRLGENTRGFEYNFEKDVANKLKPEDLKVGQVINRGDNWIITDVLGDGKFKAVSKTTYDSAQKSIKQAGNDVERANKAKRSIDAYSESFDISGKVDTENPIYKFYEKEVGKYLKNKYNAELVTDAQGVKWWELNVNPKVADQPIEAFKKGVGEGVQIPKEEADKLIRQFFNDSDIKVLFTKNMIDDVAIGKASFRKDMYSGKVGTIIKMVEQNGTVDDVTAYHESFHGFFHLYVPSGQRKVILNSIKRNIFTAPGRGLKYLEGYKGSADERAEEWLADDFADFIKNQKEYKGQNRSIFQRLLEKIRQWIRKISKVQEVYDRMLEKKARVNVAKKETTSAMKRGKKEPSEYTTMQEAIQERKKVLFKENEVNRFSKQEQEIGQLLYQRDSLQEFLDSNPAKELSKYANSNGELPEVIGSGPGDLSKTGATSKFGKSGDDIVASLGYEDSESARAAYSKYLDDKNRLTSLNQEIKSKKEALSKEKLTYKEEKILARLAEKGDKKTAELVQKEKSKADKIKEMEQTQEKLKAEEEVRRTLGEKIAAAQREEVRSKGFFAKIRQMLKPIQALDPKTKEIVETWAEDKILAKVAGQETWLEMRSKGPQTMEEVHEYEAGKNTPYIRYALDDLYDQAKAAGLEFEYKGDYLPHVYAQGPKQVAKAMVSYLKDRGLPDEEIAQYMAGTPLNKDRAARLKINPNFIKERTFPSYKAAEGYGLTPRFRTPAQLIGHYKEALETAIANRNLVKKLKSEAKLLNADDAPDSWDPVTTRFTARERLYARPELAELLNGKFRDEENLGVGQRILKGFGAVSKFMQEVTLSAGVPFTNINYFSIGQAIKLLATAMGETTSLQFKEAATSLKSAFAFVRANSNTASAKWFHENKAYIARAAMEGMDISENIGDYKVVHQRFQDLLPNLSVEDGIFGKAKAVAVSGKNIFSNFFNQAFNEKTFGSMMAQINLQIFKDNYDLMVSKGFTDKEAAKFAADTTKAFMGLTGETGRGKTTEDALSSIFFAPRFREGLINIFTQAFKGTTTEFRNKAYAKNRAFLAGMVITFALYQYLNQKTSGQYTWENPSGRQFAIRIPLPDGSIGYVEFMPSILAFPRNMSEGALALLDSDWSTAGQKFGTIFSMPLKLVTEIFSNSDYFGRQIFDPNASTVEKTKDIAKYIGLGVNHPFIKETVKYIDGDQPFYQALTYMLELPMKFSTQTKEDTGAYYDMLDDQNKKRKQAKDDVKKVYDRLQEMKAEGRVDEANDIYFGLSEGQRYLYDQIKADEKRKATNARKPKIQKIYNQLQDLKEAGRTEEANAIYYGLSDSDRKIYDSIKKAAKINAALDE